MLSEIERKLTAIVADGLSDLNHLSVVEAPASLEPSAPGRGVLRVSIASVKGTPFFVPGEARIVGSAGAPASQRVLPVQFDASFEFRVAPPTPDVAGLVASRNLLLTDVSRTAHLLGSEQVRNGRAFTVAAPDPGFEVRSFELFEGGVQPELSADRPSATLRYRAEALIWPPGSTSPEGVIRAVDPVIAALPITMHPDQPVVPAGGSTRVRLRSVPTSRLASAQTGARGVLTLAVTVQSDLPPGQRGAIVNGAPAAVSGFRIITAETNETVIDYEAPAGNLGTTRLEYVAVHLARADNSVGVFLGSAAIGLVESG